MATWYRHTHFRWSCNPISYRPTSSYQVQPISGTFLMWVDFGRKRHRRTHNKLHFNHVLQMSLGDGMHLSISIRLIHSLHISLNEKRTDKVTYKWLVHRLFYFVAPIRVNFLEEIVDTILFVLLVGFFGELVPVSGVMAWRRVFVGVIFRNCKQDSG